MTASKDPLLQPFQLKGLRLKNRVVSTAHAPGYVEDGKPKERYRRYHEEKAGGGLGLTMFGGSTNISPDSPSVFGQIHAGDDSIIPWFRALADGVHAHGAAIMCQLTHMGRRTVSQDADWLPIIGPSGTRERAHRGFPKVMEGHDIARVTADFARAVERCHKAGLDGVELLAHGHLLGQFMSPSVNRRTDDYGGSLVNRLRLTIEVLDAVRETVGDDFIIGIRLPGDELTEGGLDNAECIEIARRLEATGMVDFLNVMAGQPYTDLGLAGWVPPMGLPSAEYLEIAGSIRDAVSLPIIHAGGMADPATARHALREGMVDLVGMTRAHIADPHLVRKLERGGEERIRPCVGFGYCVDRVNQGMDALCAHNAATGREGTMRQVPEVSERPGRKIVVVGGGPAGMEAARTCAQRGHDVILLEASDGLGGQLTLAAKPASRRQVQSVPDWMAAELAHLRVDVRHNILADEETVLAEEPDVVIIATGGIPDTGNVPGADKAVSVWDVLGGGIRPEGHVIVYDDHGATEALSAALYLSERGAEVSFVTSDRAPAMELGPTTYSVILRDLYRAGVRFVCDHELTGIGNGMEGLVGRFRNSLTGSPMELRADRIVIEHGTLPMDDLYHGLVPHSSNGGEVDIDALLSMREQKLVSNGAGRFQLFRVGDAVSGRGLHAAIYDAARLCQVI